MTLLRTILPLLAASVMLPAAPATAQDTLDPRVRKLESEVRALQRRVFEGNAAAPDGLVQPEIKAPGSAGSAVGGVSAAPITDALARINALEAQLQRLTAQNEEAGFRLGQLEQKLAALESAAAAGPSSTAAATPASGAAGASPASSTPARSAAAPAARPAATTTAAAAAAKPSAERLARVQAIVMPETGDKGEDAYLYGYRLWEAKLYPEAQQQLAKVVKDFPAHARASHARNLLGRAYLDDGKPGTAATAFFENYTKLPRGERAPDSLLFLGISMHQRGDKAKACAAFDELAEAYPAIATGRLADRLQKARGDAKCAA